MSTVAAATATKEVAADGVDKAKSKKSAGAKQVAAATGAAKPTAAMPQTERKTKEGHTLADLLKMKAPALKEMCAEANVGVTGKKEVLAERLLNPSKHQSFLLKQEVVKAIKDQMVYVKGMDNWAPNSISWHRDGVKWAAFSANFPAAKRTQDTAALWWLRTASGFPCLKS